MGANVLSVSCQLAPVNNAIMHGVLDANLATGQV